MDLGEGFLDEVRPGHPARLEDERPQRLEEADLKGRQVAVLGHKSIEGARHVLRPGNERLDAEDCGA